MKKTLHNTFSFTSSKKTYSHTQKAQQNKDRLFYQSILNTTAQALWNTISNYENNSGAMLKSTFPGSQ